MSGDRTALGLALGARLGDDDDEAAQFELFSAPCTAEGAEKAQLRRRVLGRPLGSRNKRTERSLAWLLSRHRDPREVLLEIAEAQVDDLAALYGCTPLEAAQEKRLAATAVLPYVASRQPIEIDISKRSVVYLTIEGGHSRQVESAGAGIVAAVLDEVEYRETDE